MKRVGIIGIGERSKYYKAGLDKSMYFDLVAVADTNINPSSLMLYKNLPFYNSYIDMIDEKKLDYVIISSYSSTHYEIAKVCLEKGVNVLIEPPFGLNLKQTKELITFAKENTLIFDTLVNTTYFDDVNDLLMHINMFKELKEIHITLNDPYCSKTKLIDEKMKLSSGCFYEYAFEVFDMIGRILPLKKVMLIEKKTKKDSATKLDIRNNYIIYVDGVNVYLDFSWTEDSNFKNSKFDFYKSIVNICHSSRTTTIDVTSKYDYQQNGDRYLNYFNNYFMNYASKPDYERMLKIHELVFKMKNL